MRIAPIIYRVLTVFTAAKATALARSIEESTKPPSFYSNYVKAIHLSPLLPLEDARMIITACDRVTSLQGIDHSDHLLAAAENPNLRHISMTLYSGSIDFSAKIFQTIVHLDIMNLVRVKRDHMIQLLRSRGLAGQCRLEEIQEMGKAQRGSDIQDEFLLWQRDVLERL
ncbi:hypothetical protein C8J56DRAFT_14294 [Mycena floridula]|nr:hypothetical protein C8J56DRAFT_14294 [Mycena floridula]